MDDAHGYQRRALVTLAVMAIATPWLVLGAVHTMDGIHTSALGWLQSDDPERQRYQEYTDHFESGNFILVGWDGCALSDERLRSLEQSLDPRVAEDELIRELVRRVYSGQSLFEEMTRPPLDLRKRDAVARLQSTLIGNDGETTCLAVVLTEAGTERRAESVALVTDAATKATRLEKDDLYFVGPPVDALAIDLESDRNVDMFSVPSGALCLLLAWWCLRSLRLSYAILLVGGFGQLMMLGSLHYAGVTMDAVLIVLPPLVFVLTVSSGIHLINYFYDQVQSGAGDDAPRLALRQALFPCSLAAVTTAIGLGSLFVSRIVPVSMFGVFAAWGVVVTVGLLFLVVPGAMTRWPPPVEKLLARAEGSQAVRERLHRLAGGICRFSTPLTLLGIAVLVACGWGLQHVRTSINVRSLFAPDSRVIRDFAWMEENIGPLVPMEVVLSFPNESKTRMIDQLQIVEALERAIAKLDQIEGTMSVATFSPRVPAGRRVHDVAVRSLYNSRLERHRERLIDSNFLYDDADGEQWRISAHVSGLDDLDYEEILQSLREAVDPYVAQLAEQRAPGLTATYTGTMPLVYRAQHTLLEDMFSSLLTAFMLVWLVMSLLLAGKLEDSSRGSLLRFTRRAATAFWLGAVAMLPNVFPIVVVFGIMGWLDLPADIGSTMTACVALGIAVDDTLHFLAWYRRLASEGLSRVEAICSAFEHCGQAMVQTTLICGVGLLVFSLSGFVPTQRFAWLMFTLLGAALVADLIFLPAILASPLGKLFATTKITEPTERVDATIRPSSSAKSA